MTKFSLDPARAINVGSLSDVPANVSHLAKCPDEAFSLSSVNIYWDNEIQHAFIDGFTNKEYYDDYLMTTSFSESMQCLQISQVKQLIGYVTNSLGNCKSFLEVGCGDGSFLSHASNSIPSTLGIEPSIRFYNQACSKGLSVINTFLDKSTHLKIDQKFDSFASRQVFEHLDDPLEVLLSIRKMLNPGAVGLIEVPNGYRALHNKYFYEIFPDHVNYFSVNSLVSLASSAGFNVISCNESFNGHYLELWIRYDDNMKQQISGLSLSRKNLCESIAQLCDLSEAQNICIWGCGAKTMSIMPGLSKASLSKIKCIIDSDPNKSGLYMPNTSIPIVDFNSLFAEDIDKILILALSYVDEIVETVRASDLKKCSLYTVSSQGNVELIG